MRNTILILMLLFCPLVAPAQANYDKYLKEAKRNLQEGNGEKALSCYEIYKTMTGRKNKEFESMLQTYKIVDGGVSRMHLLVTKEKIDKMHHSKIMKVVRYHKNVQGSKIVVCGFGDPSLPMMYAEKLSTLQASSVAEFLIKNAEVAPENISMQIQGSIVSDKLDYNILIYVEEE